MTSEFTQEISYENEGSQKGNGGPSRMDDHEAHFFTDLDALTYADSFSSMEVEP